MNSLASSSFVTKKLVALNISSTLYWNLSPLPQTLLQSSASRKTQKKKKKKVNCCSLCWMWERSTVHWAHVYSMNKTRLWPTVQLVVFRVTCLIQIYLHLFTDLYLPFHILQASKTAENATGQPTEDTEAVE